MAGLIGIAAPCRRSGGVEDRVEKMSHATPPYRSGVRGEIKGSAPATTGAAGAEPSDVTAPRIAPPASQ
jgi:hypothetical protein